MLAFIDRFGLPFKFTFDNKILFKSALGGLFTILMILIISTCIYVFGIQIITRNKPNVVDTEEKITQHHNFSLEIPISIYMQDKYSKIIPDIERYVDINLYFMNSTWSENGGLNIIPNTVTLEKCERNSFHKTLGDVYDYLSLKNSWCIPFSNLTVSGYYTLKQINYYEIKVSKCTNSTKKKVSCYPQDIIDTSFSYNDKQISMNYVNYDFVPKNFTNSTIPSINTLHFRIDNSLCKTNEIFVDTLQIDTDAGYINKQSVTETYQVIKRIERDLYIKSNINPNCYVDIKVFAGDKNQLFNRSYMKIPELLAQLGGIIHIFTTIFTFILSSIYFRRMNEHIIRTIFNIDNEEVYKDLGINYQNNKNKIEKKTKKITTENKNKKIGEKNENNEKLAKHFRRESSEICYEKTNVDKSSNKIFNKTSNEISDINNSNSESNSLEKRNSKINVLFSEQILHNWFFSLWDNFIIIFCSPCKSRRLSTLNMYYKKLLDYANIFTDAVTIAEKVNEIEKIKVILFSKPQLMLLNLIAKLNNPLSNDTKNKLTQKYIFSRDINSNRENVEKCLKFYDEQDPRKLDKIDKILLDLIQ